MTVTEIAIVHSNSGGLSEELKNELLKAQEIQDGWVQKTFPGPFRADRSAMYQQVEDPSKILLTAQWESVAQHWQWIGSDANQQAMATLMSHIAIDGDNKIVLSHIGANIFDSPAHVGSTHVLDSPIISVGRMFIDADSKETFQRELDGNIRFLEVFAKPHTVRGGWRLDKEADTQEEYVMLVGWDSVDKHMAFAQSPDFSKYAGIRQFVTGAEIKHYKRFL